MPAAERDVPVAAPLARFLERLPPRVLRAVRLALVALEWQPFPRRLSRLPLDDRSEVLSRMAGSRLRPRRELLLAAKTLALLGWGGNSRVRAAIGYEPGCEAADPPTGDGPGPLLELTAPAGDGDDCDVAIVGSGAGGAAAALRLAEAGLDVLVLEAGPHLNRASYPSDPLEAISTLYRDGGLTVARGSPAIPVPVGRAVGGTTVVNSGTCFRAPPGLLAAWRERAGIHWADQLDSEYEAAERALAVAPVDPERMGRNGQLCMEGAATLGASGAPISRNAGRCVRCGSCPTGCPLDAKRAMHVSLLPLAAAAGARVLAGVEALRVRIEGDRAVGLDCRAGSPAEASTTPRAGDRGERRSYGVRARAVVCAAGALGTPELLLRSGVRHPRLGRGLHVHPAAWIGARYEQEVRGWEGVMQSYYVDQWRQQGILLEATFTPLAFGAQWLPGVGRAHAARIREWDRIASIGVHLHDRSEGRVGVRGDGSLRLGYRLSGEDARRIQFGIARAAEIHFAAGATEVYPNVGPVDVLPRGRLAEFEAVRLRAGDLRLEAFHPMGTARMGSDPDLGVIDADGAVRGIESLYVTDASALPTSLGVNPMMTVIACASRLAASVAERLSGP